MTLHDHNNVLHHSVAKMNDILSNFYQDLYTQGNLFGGSPKKWLGESNPLELTKEERGALGDSITQEEMERAISDLKQQKEPGPDGYTGEFLKSLKKKSHLPLLIYSIIFSKEPLYQSM